MINKHTFKGTKENKDKNFDLRMQKEVESNVVVDSEAKPVESQEATGEEHHPVVVDSGDLEQTLEPASAPEESKKIEV